MIVEICIDSVESAIKAENGGAHRLELCANLVEGGTTPSLGMITECTKNVSIPIMVIVRPRGGDFLYSDNEIEVMKSDIACIKKYTTASGIVIGVLDENGNIDVPKMEMFKVLAHPLEITFHRAIDVSCDPLAQVQVCARLGLNRILTSGGYQTAFQGSDTIRKMVDLANTLNIKIMAGAGIDETNVIDIVNKTGVTEVHGSLRTVQTSKMKYKPNPPVYMGAEKRNDEQVEFITKQVSTERVQNIMTLLSNNQ